MTFTCNGSSLAIADDGVTTVSTTDTNITAAGKAGIGTGANPASSAWDNGTQDFDDFQCKTSIVLPVPLPHPPVVLDKRYTLAEPERMSPAATWMEGVLQYTR